LKRWRLIIDSVPGEGAWNMALDEFLFQSLTDEPRTVVRFYQWARPTVSVGYSQDLSRVVDADFCRRLGVDIVRRLTGGKVVLHHRELTYAICSSDAGTFTEKLADSYRLISRGLMNGLAMMGVETSLAGPPPASYIRGVLPCFAHPGLDEVEWEGRKIIGSAQKRVAARFLQHGSIPLVKEEELLRAVSFLEGGLGELRMASLEEALGRPVGFTWAARRLAAGLEDFFGVEFEAWAPGPEEREAVLRLSLDRYANPDWTDRRTGGPAS
jgi:lipoate-protein ligase A